MKLKWKSRKWLFQGRTFYFTTLSNLTLPIDFRDRWILSLWYDTIDIWEKHSKFCLLKIVSLKEIHRIYHYWVDWIFLVHQVWGLDIDYWIQLIKLRKTLFEIFSPWCSIFQMIHLEKNYWFKYTSLLLKFRACVFW